MATVKTTKTVNQDKYRHAILYFLQNCNNEYLGTTKLNKLLYYLDFVSFRDTRSSVTGEAYLHLDYGPVPQGINTTLVDLNSNGLIEAEDRPFRDSHKVKFTTLVDPDVSVFTEYERRLLSAICNEFELWSTQKIVDQTHLESPWLYSEPYGPVDYELATDIDLFQDVVNA